MTTATSKAAPECSLCFEAVSDVYSSTKTKQSGKEGTFFAQR